MHYTLDAAGNRIREEVKDASGVIALVTARIINSLNKVAAIQGSVGQTTQLAYDANGEPIAQTDPLNQTTRQTPGRPAPPHRHHLPGQHLRQPGLEPAGPAHPSHRPQGRANQLPDQRLRRSGERNQPGHRHHQIHTRCQWRRHEHRRRQRPDQPHRARRPGPAHPIEYAQGHSASFSYDAAGHVSRIDDKSGSTHYERDAQGRILSRTQLVNDNPSSPMQLEDSYGYQGGDLTSIGLPQRPESLLPAQRTAASPASTCRSRPAASKTPAVVPFVSDLTHTALGQPKSWRWANGDSSRRTFDTDGRMTAKRDSPATPTTRPPGSPASPRTCGRSARWSAARQTVTELYQTPISWTAGYDSRNRLTSFARAGAQTKYSYDANSNRLTAIDTTSSEIDLEGAFDQPDFTQSASQSLNIDASQQPALGVHADVDEDAARAAP